MGNEKGLGLAGLLCCAFVVCFFLPQKFVGESGTRQRSSLRKERAAGNGDCLSVLIAGESVKTLTSPNYPDPYPSNAHCRWLLTTLEPNDTISIKIDELHIEPETECRLDYLQVFLGSNEREPSLGPFCGHVNDRVVDSNSSTLLLVFRSDLMYEEKGFSIDYYIPTTKGGCRKLVTDASDTLTSPAYPDAYPDETDCSTLISVEEDKVIFLHFDFVDLEFGENCTFDYIRIFDGKDTNSALLGQMCGQSNAVVFESSTHQLLVHFHSDGTVHRRGYRARYSSVDKRSLLIGNCQWDNGGSNGTITSPNYPENYPSYANCSLWIQAPDPTTKILVILDTVHLEMDSNCSYDFLQITEGDQLVGRYCGRGTEPKSLLSGGSEINIKFQSDSFVEFQGFKLYYEFVKGDSEKDETEELFLRASPRNASLEAGSSHMLHCDTEYPNARIRWLKDDVFLAGDTPLPGVKLLANHSLWIRNMQRPLAGEYTCVAVSPETEISATAHVEMKEGSFRCGIEFRQTPSDSVVREGDFAHLECLAAVPEVQLSWQKDGQPLQHRQHVTVLKNGYIFMNRVRLTDAGLYTCVARDAASGCEQKVSALLKVVEVANIQDICGRPRFGEAEKSLSEHGKIVAGYDAPKGAYPWQVMLWEAERKSFCGASLLNERWIVTAAHCIADGKHNISWDRIVVKLGKHDTQREEEEEVHTTIADASAIITHPDFQPATYDNDLALVRLRDRAFFTDHILPICLADQELSDRLLNGDGMGTVVGWGKLKENGLSPRFLQEIKLPIVHQEACRRSTNYSVTRNMFCAGYSQEVIGDSCQGDSGGPFMMKHEGKWYLLGIVSWGEGCGKKNKYGFYTRIQNHLSWIQGIIKS